ncbi:hypothetical protein IQ07DRAFT_613474 [Pyrenochaeta sp. DS3sAY3a]|nr:hypothetical protein IQ07DRAFT_613474 [Pyrenochaeta sp. DS3sAY3a]
MELATASLYSSVDFVALAKNDAAFKQIWQASKKRLDFSDPETVQILSKAILKTDFGLQLEVPEDRLCPTIPNRWNYVAWLHGLLDSTSPDYSGKYDQEREVVGLDIGAGASAIYSMLCLRARPKWHMCATDIDKKSFESGARNLALNGLMTRTTLLQTIEGQPLIPLAALGKSKLDFTICNPPFFDSPAEMQGSLEGEGKATKPNAVCTGAEVEMVCPGGDLGFVTRIVEESLVLREKVQWYSSMFGKLESAKAIITLLKAHGITNWAVGIIDTGSSTKRWTVAWSFMDLRPRNGTARIEPIAHEFLPFPTAHSIALRPSVDVLQVLRDVDKLLEALDVVWTWDRKASIGVGEATQNVWSRGYRRAQMRKAKERDDKTAPEDSMHDVANVKGKGKGNEKAEYAPADETDDAQDAMAIDATVSPADAAADQAQDPGDAKVQLAFRVRVVMTGRYVELEWLRGSDQKLWESFCGFMRTQSKKW